jgi:hypothetical protein
MTEQFPSRIERGRRRAARAKRALVAGAAASFLAVAGLAYSGHAGANATPSGTSGDSSTYPDDGSFDFGSGSIAPSGSAQPQVGTGVS